MQGGRDQGLLLSDLGSWVPIPGTGNPECEAGLGKLVVCVKTCEEHTHRCKCGLLDPPREGFQAQG